MRDQSTLGPVDWLRGPVDWGNCDLKFHSWYLLSPERCIKFCQMKKFWIKHKKMFLLLQIFALWGCKFFLSDFTKNVQFTLNLPFCGIPGSHQVRPISSFCQQLIEQPVLIGILGGNLFCRRWKSGEKSTLGILQSLKKKKTNKGSDSSPLWWHLRRLFCSGPLTPQPLLEWNHKKYSSLS